MPEISEPKQLLLAQLQSVLYVEQQLVSQALPEMEKNVESPDLKEDIAHHLEETRSHVENVRRAIDMLGGEAKPEQNQIIEGFKKEYNEMLQKLSPGPLLDLFHTGFIAKNEHVEIATYNGLIECCEALDEDEVANLLRENLDQEEEALKKAEKGMKKLLKEKVTA
jgi:ferritin-like metal-binding protein YciE